MTALGLVEASGSVELVDSKKFFSISDRMSVLTQRWARDGYWEGAELA